MLGAQGMGARRNFRRGGRALKRPPSRRKRPPPKKKIEMGLGGMLPRENFNNGAPYDILDASQQGRI